ncbi:MAG: DUF4154 domain-containing protein [Candidatus Cloacimonetes bacterium]|nr:DUF4154 domain-containing protein [Candidatus Cloacimonadota bacterium]
MKWLKTIVLGLSLGVAHADLPLPDQAKLIGSLIASSGLNLEKVVIGIHGGDTNKRTELRNALMNLKQLKVGAKVLPIEVRLLETNEIPADCNVLYVFSKIDLPAERSILSFTDNRQLVESGVLAGLTREGVQPKIFMNMETLKLLGLKYPANLLKMVTLVRN